VQYAVNVVCGRSTGTPLARGAYFTGVQVYNPAHEPCLLRIAFAHAGDGLRGGHVSPFETAELGPGEALAFDCPEIREAAGVRDGLLRGFVVIESAMELDVVAVHTVANTDGDATAARMERVSGRP